MLQITSVERVSNNMRVNCWLQFLEVPGDGVNVGLSVLGSGNGVCVCVWLPLQEGSLPPVLIFRRSCGVIKRGKVATWRSNKYCRLKAKPYRVSLPSILFTNSRSLEAKMDYTRLDLIIKQEVRNCYVIIATKTWLKHSVPDSAVSLVGFSTFWLDRSLSLSGKSCQGGVCFYIRQNKQARPSLKCLSKNRAVTLF